MSLRLGLFSFALARVLGRAVGKIKSRGTNVLLLLLAAVVVVSLVDTLTRDALHLPKLELSGELWNGLLLLAAVGILLWALKARRRLVVEEFADHAADARVARPTEGDVPVSARAPSNTTGVATLLTLNLTRLANLHHGTDAPRAVSTHAENGGRQGKMVLAGISSDSDPDFLRHAVSAESNVTVGPLNIPVGLLVGFLGRLARGPRVVGGLHLDGESLILTAQVAGAGRPYGWKVTRKSSGSDPALAEMVEELACRIYTDLAMDRTTKWRATRCFAQGLDAYRDTLRTPLERRLNLRQAERSFLEASAEDQNFDLAYYDLGVVYRDLGKPQAAYSAFLRTIELNPDRLEAYYALAANRWRQRDYESAVKLCDRVLAGGAAGLDAAAALNLRSLALCSQSGAHPEWSAVLRDQRRAVAHARRALFRSCLSTHDDRDREIERSRVELSTCLVTMAFACRRAASADERPRALRRAQALIEQAIALEGSAAQTHFALGDVRARLGRDREAADAFRAAAQISPGNVDYWAHLALALANAGDQPRASAAVKRALASPYTAPDDALTVAARALTQLGEGSEAERVASMKPLLRELAEEVNIVERDGTAAQRVASMSTFLSELSEQIEQLEGFGTEPGEPKAMLCNRKHALRRRLSTEDWRGRAWECSQNQIVLAYLATRDEDWLEAERRLEAAIAALEEEHPAEIAERGLRAELARVQLHQGRKSDALSSAQAAVDVDPLSPKARTALAEVRSSLGEHEAAKEALEVALLRAPEAPDGHVRLGQCFLTLAYTCRDRKRRQELLAQATTHLKQALDLYPSDQLHQAVRAQELLGRVQLELHEYSEAIARFEIVLALQRRPGLVALEQLGVAYLANADYPHTETVCQDVIERAGDGDPAEILDRRGSLEVSRGELLAKAHLLRAQARVERDVELHRALDLVRHAKRYLRDADRDRLDGQRLGAFADIEADCWACEGLILFKQGKLDGALRRLERAALLRGDPETYLKLARVAAEKLELEPGSEPDRHTLLARAEAYCRRATHADTASEHTEAIGEVLRRVASLRGELDATGRTPLGAGRLGDEQTRRTSPAVATR